MLSLTDTENYLPNRLDSVVIALACKSAPFRTRPEYSLIGSDAQIITGASSASSLEPSWQLSEYHHETETLYYEFIEYLAPALSAVHIPSIWFKNSALFRSQQQQHYCNIFDNAALTIYDKKLNNFIESSSPAITNLLERDDLFILHDIYEFNYAGEEELFIRNNGHLVLFLTDAINHITRICGADINVKLQYNRDEEEAFETLFIIIQTRLSADQNISLLKRIDNEWWLMVDYNVRKFISIDIDS